MRGVRSVVLALAGAATLGACTVDVEGAACTAPGTTDHCPSGQACGTGLKCSTRAASCAPCAVGSLGCRDGDVKRCTGDDPVCGAWVVETACDIGVTHCADRIGVGPVCGCDRFVVDPAGASSACSFGSIAEAIVEAQAIAADTVWLGGPTGQTYGLDAADAAPIVIPAGMTVSGDDAPLAAEGRVVEVQGGSGEGVRVEAGGRLAGVTVLRGSGAPAVAVRVLGASGAAGASLASVHVDDAGAGGPFATGLLVEGTGAVTLDDVEVIGATGEGLRIARDAMVDAVTVSGAVLTGNGVGVRLQKGDLTLVEPTVKGNVAEGVNADGGATGTTRLTIQDGLIARNGGGGIVVSRNDRLHLERNRVCANTGVTRLVNGTNRSVGGLVALGDSPGDLLVKGNLFHDNGGDQVLVGASTTPWNLTAANCDSSERNVFAGYSSPGVGVTAVNAAVAAKYAAWKGSGIPTVSVDYFAAVGGSVDAYGAAAEYCPAAGASDLVCPP